MVVISSRPSEPCTTQTDLRAQVLQDLGEWLDPLPREHPDHLTLDPGRIRERTQQVEDGTGAELDARGPDVLHRRMMRRREHEADAGLVDAPADPLGRELDIDTERAQHVGSARARGQCPVAVLGDRHARARHDEGRAGRDVIGARGVAAGAHHVDGILRSLNPQHLLAHGGDRAGDLVDGLAANAQRHQQSAHLRGRRFAGHHGVETVRRLVACERGAGRRLGDQSLECIGHRRLTLHASRELRRRGH